MSWRRRRYAEARGSALVSVIVLAAILGLIAAALVEMSFNRTVLFQRTRDRQHGGLAGAAGMNEITACLNAQDYPPVNDCAGWSEWDCGIGGCTAERSSPYIAQAAVSEYDLSAYWKSDGTLIVDARLR